MLRRVVIGVSACVLVAVVVGALAIQRFVFGGTPIVHRPSLPAASITATPCATLALSAGERGFALESQRSTAGYEAHFLAAGASVPGSVDGVTGFVTGGFIVSPNPNPVIRSLLIRVDLRTLDSGSADRDVLLRGALTLHGVTRPVTFAMNATLQGETLTGSGTAHVHTTDFGMKQPQITSVVHVTIADDIALSITFVAHSTTCALPQ